MQKTDFNRGWTVQKDGGSTIRQVNLPDDAMLYEQRKPDAKSGSGGAFYEGGKYLYRKSFEIPEDRKDETYILEFEGVYQNSEVWLNGKKISEWPYGYTNFFVNLTGRVQAGNNELLVIADNSGIPNTRWYSGSGIYREVSLYTAGKNWIAPEGIKVETVADRKIRIRIEGSFGPDCQVLADILDDQGELVTSARGTDITRVIPDGKLWDEDHPYLYTCTVRLMKDGKLEDEASVRFGLRTLSWGGKGLLLNGKPVLLRGACIHHDNGILGACDFRDAEYRRIRILKEAGFNAIRSSHNPVSKAMLDACDEMGMYVLDEAFDMWLIHKNPYDYAGDTFRQWWKKDIEAMISKDYSHPSVLMYSVGNEISELGREDGQQAARELVDWCHKLDPTRPVSAGINLALAQMASLSKNSKPFTTEEEQIKDDTAGAPTSEFFNKMMNYLGGQMDKAASTKKANKIADTVSEIFDIPGYNYATSRYEVDAKARPDQCTMGSETFTHSLYTNWNHVKNIPTLIGDFMWTGWDYLGESAIGTIRYMDKKTKKDIDPGLIITSGAGVIDICGKQRPETGWNKIVWGLQDTPEIGVSPYTHASHFKSKRMWRKADTIASWSWEGCEGQTADVSVYSDAPKVELLCDGKSLGVKKTKEYAALFKKVPYGGSLLEAVALDGAGREISRSRLEAATGKTQILLNPEKDVLKANGQDLCYLNIDLAGENGITKSSVDQKLSVNIEGPGSLQGYGSSRPNMAENFLEDTHTTYYGKSLAVIRTGYEPGTIKVTVSGEGLEPRSAEIAVVPA